jgi:RNA polymerase sigma factor (sigma-70 family)
MAERVLSAVLRYLSQAVQPLEAAEETDGQLLERFVTRRENAALETLIRRHGPLVLGVCRRLLHDEHDADDAFQATFLILIRKASTLESRPSLAGWLYGVAQRVALNARKARARRPRSERQVEVMVSDRAAEQVNRQELWSLVDAELNQLPDKYRSPLLLCYLEGKTNEEAARELGWPAGSISYRLARGRELLAQRLTRRGVALSAGGIATALSERVALAALPSDLLGRTVTVADALVAKGTVVGVAAAEVSALVEEVMRSMLLTRLKITAAAALAVALLTAGGTALGYRALSNPAPAPTLTARTPLVFTEDLSRLGRHEVQVYAAVKPKAEELKWQQIPWLLDHTEALRIAQQERRPLCVWVSAHDPLDRCCGYAAGLRAGPLSHDDVVRCISEKFVPVALNKFVETNRPFIRSLQRQKDQYQGLWVVSPDGAVLAAHHDRTDRKAWPQEVLAALEAGLTAFGPVEPRQAKPADLQPLRGVAAQRDGSVSLALHIRLLRSIATDPQGDGPVVFDTLTLSAREWARMAPAKVASGAEWTVPETTALKLSRLLSVDSDPTNMPLPEDVTAVRLAGKVQTVENGIAYLLYNGEISGGHVLPGRNKFSGVDATVVGVGAFDPEARQMLSLTLVLEGTFYEDTPPIKENTPRRPAGAVVEWRYARAK